MGLHYLFRIKEFRSKVSVTKIALNCPLCLYEYVRIRISVRIGTCIAIVFLWFVVSDFEMTYSVKMCKPLATFRRFFALFVGICVLFTLLSPADARRFSHPNSWNAEKYAAIVIDANTDRVLFSRNANKRRYPASLTKMMTLYILFDEIESGRVRKKTLMSVSKHAASQVPSCLGLKPGKTISVENAIRALVTKSANDVAVVIAEHISGSERAFAKRMTAVARKLGMKRTVFRNASGLHDRNQYTSANDMSILSRALYRQHPNYYPYFSLKSFTFERKKYHSHNHLVRKFRGVDGIKTGYTNASGFNLASSMRSNGQHLIAVVMGGPSGSKRNKHMENLLFTHILNASKTRNVRWEKKNTLQFVGAPVPQMLSSPIQNPRSFSKLQIPAPVVLAEQRSGYASQNSPDPSSKLKRTPSVGKRTGILTRKEAENLNQESLIRDLSYAKNPTKTWMIQIGAYNQKEMAQRKLNEALLKHSSLKNRLGYTEPVHKDDTTLYRARFEGFDREDARKTCHTLRKAKFKCLPMVKR